MLSFRASLNSGQSGPRLTSTWPSSRDENVAPTVAILPDGASANAGSCADRTGRGCRRTRRQLDWLRARRPGPVPGRCPAMRARRPRQLSEVCAFDLAVARRSLLVARARTEGSRGSVGWPWVHGPANG